MITMAIMTLLIMITMATMTLLIMINLCKDGTDMNVQPAWESGFTGKGVVVTILGIVITIIIMPIV